MVNTKGVRIMNLEGADILKNKLEDRILFKKYVGIFDYSLLNQKLQKTMKVSKNNTTRDIITVQFKYGYNSLKIKNVELDIAKVEKSLKFCKVNEVEKLEAKLKNLEKVKSRIEENIKNGTVINKLDVSEIRDKLYIEEFKIDYTNKKETKTETIEYVFWFRTPSKARVGDCYFINKKLYKNIMKWQQMGLEIERGKQGKVVEMGAYMSLTSSAIEGTITIDPDSILVVNDLESFTETMCANVMVEKDTCKVENKLSKVKNILFDGQALADESLFENKNGMMLLRQHFFKACAFRTYIQKFMKDFCFKNLYNYNTYSVKDRYGNDILVKNIKIITTENAMKWEKFQDIGASFDLWKEKVNEDNNIFGICKVDHSSKYGKMQRMSYQHINTLPVTKDDIAEIGKYTIDNINNLKDDDIEFIEFLKFNANCTNANNMVVDLCKENEKFIRSDFFKDYKNDIIKKHTRNIKSGKLLIQGDNLTVVGNPYVMLLHSVGAVLNVNNVIVDWFADETLPRLDKGVSVYTTKFESDEELAAFRNPHNSPNNVGYHKNFKHELMSKYFNFSPNIMAYNAIKTDEQDRKNGMDNDSDFVLVTNAEIIVRAAEKCLEFPTIVNKIETENKSYINTLKSLSGIDNNLAKAKNDIGISSNLAQMAMSYYWDKPSKELANVVATLSVLAQIAIDNAKRIYSVDVAKEIEKIRKLDCMQRTKINTKSREIKLKPMFWQYVSSKVNKQNLDYLNCPMDFLQEVINDEKTGIKNGNRKQDTIITSTLIVNVDGKAKNEQMDKIESLVIGFDNEVKAHAEEVAKKGKETDVDKDKWFKKEEILYDDVVAEVSKMKLSEKTINRLINKALENSKDKRSGCTKYKRKLLNVLYKSHKRKFLDNFKN